MRRQYYSFPVFILISFILILANLQYANAVAIGVNRASLGFENVLKGGYAEGELVVSTDATNELFIKKELIGDISSWISFEPKELVVSADSPGVLKVIIQPPEDAANGNYEGEIRLISSPLIEGQSGKFGSAILTSFLIKVNIEVVGDQYVACTAGGFSLFDAEITYPLIFTGSVKNNGNVKIKPNFKIDVWNQDQTKLITTKEFTYNLDILPTTTQTITRDLDDIVLDTGQYWAYISSPLCGQQSLVTFSVLEKGEIVDKGDILSVTNDLWVKVGDIVPITVVFKNTGSRAESAKLKGTIKLGDQIIKVIDTDAVNVLAGETVDLETFFNPKMAGQYQINVRVLYNNKLTFWKNSILNALPSEEFEAKMKELDSGQTMTTIILIILIVIILLLLIIIKKKKNNKRRQHF